MSCRRCGGDLDMGVLIVRRRRVQQGAAFSYPEERLCRKCELALFYFLEGQPTSLVPIAEPVRGPEADLDASDREWPESLLWQGCRPRTHHHDGTLRARPLTGGR